MHVKHNWRQHFVSDSSDSEHTDNDLVAYASAAVVAMEESDDDIFSIQLPESPKCLTDVRSFANQTEPLLMLSGEAKKSYAQGKNKSNCKRFKSAKGGDRSQVKIGMVRIKKDLPDEKICQPCELNISIHFKDLTPIQSLPQLLLRPYS